MRAEVRVGEASEEIELPISELLVALPSYLRDGRVVGFFSGDTAVPDDANCGAVSFEDGVPSIDWDSRADDEASSVVVLLESPHKDEYRLSEGRVHPIGPAQGSTGKRLKDCLESRMREFDFPVEDGDYRLAICNPVPFQASLYHLCALDRICERVRDETWRRLWCGVEQVREDFRHRLHSYGPVAIVNLGTRNLRPLVSTFLSEDSQGFLEGNHPSSWQWPRNRRLWLP